MKKIIKFISSKLFYVLIGLFLAITIFTVQAAWNSKVNSGDSLTVTLWNDIVAKLIELDSRGMVYITPVSVHSGGASVAYTTYDASGSVPVGAKAVILEVEANMAGPDGGDVDAHIKIRTNTGASEYVLLRGRSASSGDNVAWSSQGIFPVSANRTFQYKIEAPGFGGCEIRLIGYVR